MTGEPSARRRFQLAVSGVVVGAGLAAATLVRFGADADGLAWAAVQLLLVFLAAFDVATRRIPNRATLPAAVAVVVVRALFERGALAESLVAGAGAFAAFLLVALLARGGFGMGDVKLAGLLGLLLGGEVLPALLIGTVAGGLASAAVLASRRGSRRSTIAYGPYLCLGSAVAILALQPLPLV